MPFNGKSFVHVRDIIDQHKWGMKNAFHVAKGHFSSFPLPYSMPLTIAHVRL